MLYAQSQCLDYNKNGWIFLPTVFLLCPWHNKTHLLAIYTAQSIIFMHFISCVPPRVLGSLEFSVFPATRYSIELIRRIPPYAFKRHVMFQYTSATCHVMAAFTDMIIYIYYSDSQFLAVDSSGALSLPLQNCRLVTIDNKNIQNLWMKSFPKSHPILQALDDIKIHTIQPMLKQLFL